MSPINVLAQTETTVERAEALPRYVKSLPAVYPNHPHPGNDISSVDTGRARQESYVVWYSVFY